MRFLHLIQPFIFTLFLVNSTFADIFINEIRTDTPGEDLAEYFELYNNGNETISLDDYTYLVIGDGAGGNGVLESVTSLSDLSIPANGYITAFKSAPVSFDAEGDSTIDLTTSGDATISGNFENSDNVTHLLVTGFTGSNADDLDTNDDGTLDTTPWTSVIDAIALKTNESNDRLYAIALGFPDNEIGPDGAFAPRHLFRSPDGGTLVIGEFGTAASPNPNTLAGSSTATLQDSPGQANPLIATGSLQLMFNPASILESSSEVITATVTRLDGSGAPLSTGDLIISTSSSDSTEATVTGITTIVDGSSSATFDITPVDDMIQDGPINITISATGIGFSLTEGSVIIEDDPSDISDLVINEVHYAIDMTNGDANSDGQVSAGSTGSDQFIEILNISAAQIDLSDYRLQESFTLGRNESIHTFPEGTTLAPGCAIVIFGGEGITPGHTAAFGEAEVQIASNGSLFLNDTGDALILKNADNEEVASVILPDLSTQTGSGSLTLATDSQINSGYTLHGPANTATLFSPGIRQDGSAYCDITETLTITPSSSSIVEGSTVTFTVSIPTTATSDIFVRIQSSDENAILPFDFPNPIIPAGETSVVIEAEATDNDLLNDTKMVTVRAIASGYFNTSTMVDVTDDGDPPLMFSTDIVINEIDADTFTADGMGGTDQLEFIELYNNSSTTQSLDNLFLVLINGDNDSVYNVIDLSGHTIPANGFFVIGSNAITNADIGFTATNNSNLLQNGADGVALFGGNITISNGDTLNSVTGDLQDALVYGNNHPNDMELLAVLPIGQTQLNESANGNSPEVSISRTTDGGAGITSSAFGLGAPTPGAPNQAIVNGFSAWATTNGISGAMEDNDDDQDNIPALIEYALGLDPNAFDILPHLVSQPSGNFSITFPKGSEAAMDATISYTIQMSETLAPNDWMPLTPTTDTSSEISATVIPSTSFPKVFVRILID